jgi:hypothetical protein
MEFVYESAFTPCTCEEQHAFYVPFVLSLVIMAGVLGMVIGSVEDDNLDMVLVGVIAGVLGLLSLLCFTLSCCVLKDVCFQRRIVEWQVLSQEVEVKS